MLGVPLSVIWVLLLQTYTDYFSKLYNYEFRNYYLKSLSTMTTVYL